jgi:integrase
MRRSEILGFQWLDFDFDGGTLTVTRIRREERTIDEAGGTHMATVTYSPKTASSQ